MLVSPDKGANALLRLGEITLNAISQITIKPDTVIWSGCFVTH